MGNAAFIFDMDGTLVDNARFHAEAWRICLSGLGVELPGVELQALIGGRTNEQVLSHVFGGRLPPDQMMAYSERKEGTYRSLVAPYLRPLPGLLRFLDESAHMGIGLAVATSAGPANIEFTLDRLGVQDLFEVVVGERDVENGKPDPESFLTAARRLRVSPEHCLVFEDSTAGVEAARRAGMAVVAVATTQSPASFQGMPSVQLVIADYSSLKPDRLLRTLA